MTSNSTPVTVRLLHDPAELRSGVRLYREVLGLADTDPAVSPRLLASLVRNGGSVMGAFAGEELIGFAYGFIGKDPSTGELYHYSQTAVVAAGRQGQGVGRALKLGQREYVRSTGITRMRWSYDPVRASNAHFNLDVLGGRARWFVRDYYGLDEMGRDRGHRSDRLIVEWDLAGPPSLPPPSTPATSGTPATPGTPPPTPTAPSPLTRQSPWDSPRPEPEPPSELTGAPARMPGWGEAVRSETTGEVLLVGIPRHWAEVATDHERAAKVRKAVSDALEPAIAHGFVACSCQVVEAGAEAGGSASAEAGDSALAEATTQASAESDALRARAGTAVYVLRKEDS